MKSPTLRPRGLSPSRSKLRLGAFALALSSAAIGSLTTGAQAQEQAATIEFKVGAGPLGPALTQFAAAAGITLSFESSQTQGLQTGGISGRYSIDQGFEQLLAGSGLQAHHRGDGNYVLKSAPVSAGGATMMSAVRVVENVSDATLSDGTQSYAARASRSATGLTLSPRETPQSISVITRQRLDDQNITEILDALDQTVGITVYQGGPIGSDSNTIYSRGFIVNNFQVDGVTRSSNYGYRDDVSDMAVFDRVEVIRGAAGLLTGTGDPSAVVSMWRKRPTTTPTATVSAQTGSWQHYRTELDVSGPLIESGAWRGRLVAVHQDNDWYIDRQHTDKNVLYGVSELDLGERTLWTAGIEYQEFRSDEAARGGFPLFYTDGTPTRFPRSFNTSADWTYLSRRNFTAFSTIEHQFGNDWQVRLNLEESRRKYDDMLGYAAGGRPNADGSGVFIYPGRWAQKPQQTSGDLAVSGPFELFGQKHELMFGFSGYYARSPDGYNFPLWWFTDYDSSIPNIFEWDGDIAQPDITATGDYSVFERQSGAYLSARLRPFEPMSVIVGARFSQFSRETRSRNFTTEVLTRTAYDKDDIFTPYVGLTYDIGKVWSVYASYTTIFKAQSNLDVNGNFLDPLEGENIEGGIKAELFDERLNASLSVFHTEQDNLAVIDTGNFAPDGSQAYIGVKGTSTKGYEAELAGEPLSGWRLGTGYSYAKSEDRNGARLQTQIPKSSFKFFSTYDLRGALNKLTLGGNLRWQGDAYALNAGPNGITSEQKSYALLDLMGRYRATEQFSLNLNVNNVFDKRYYSAFSGAGYYGEPRSVMLTLRYKLF